MAEPKVDKFTFDKVKELSKKEVTMADIAAITNLSKATISRIKSAKDLDSYRQQLRAIHAETATRRKMANAPVTIPSPEPKPPIQSVVKIEANHYMMEELRKTNETLTRMARQMTILMETSIALLETWAPEKADKIFKNT